MTEKTHGKELDALKTDMAILREELTGLVAGVKKSAAGKEDPLHDEEDQGVWMDILRKFESSTVQGEKVVRGLTAEVEQQPLVSILAAFGLGYIIAKLWYQENKENKE